MKVSSHKRLNVTLSSDLSKKAHVSRNEGRRERGGVRSEESLSGNQKAPCYDAETARDANAGRGKSNRDDGASE